MQFSNLRRIRLLSERRLQLAVLAVSLLPAVGMSQVLVLDEHLQREWLEIQENKDRRAKKQWWQHLNPDQLNAFLRAGAQVNVADSRRWTPLHSAARYNSDRSVLLALLQAGSIVDAKDRSGNTPLHWAAAENTNVDIAIALIDAGADVNASDRFGWLPIHTAAEGNTNPELIAVLLAAGAKRNRRAYFLLLSPGFLLKHNENISERAKDVAIALLREPDQAALSDSLRKSRH